MFWISLCKHNQYITIADNRLHCFTLTTQAYCRQPKNGSPVLPLQVRQDVFWTIYWLHIPTLPSFLYFKTWLFAIYNFYELWEDTAIWTHANALDCQHFSTTAALKDYKVSQPRKPLSWLTSSATTFPVPIIYMDINHVKILYSCNPPYVHKSNTRWNISLNKLQWYPHTIILEIIWYRITNDSMPCNCNHCHNFSTLYKANFTPAYNNWTLHYTNSTIFFSLNDLLCSVFSWYRGWTK